MPKISFKICPICTRIQWICCSVGMILSCFIPISIEENQPLMNFNDFIFAILLNEWFFTKWFNSRNYLMTEKPIWQQQQRTAFFKKQNHLVKMLNNFNFYFIYWFAPNEKTFKWFVVDNNKTIVQIFERFFLLSHSFFSLNCVYFAE